jgi:hypothetical protein
MKVLHKKGFFNRLSPYNKPKINIFLGIFFSMIQGCVFPSFGLFLSKALFALMIVDKEDMKE